MTDEPENLTLRYLRKLDEKSDRHDERLNEITAELRSIKTHIAAFMQAELAQDGSIASILTRLDKIERRLDLNN